MTTPIYTPRVLPSHLQAFASISRPSAVTVRMLGTMSAFNGDRATLTSGRGENTTIILNRDSNLQAGEVYEIVGKVITIEGTGELGLRVLSSIHWPKPENGQIDFKAFESVVDVTHRYKEIFYEGAGPSEGGY